jgi:hypothetical protein
MLPQNIFLQETGQTETELQLHKAKGQVMQKQCNREDGVNRIVVSMNEQQDGKEQDIPETGGHEPQPIDTIHIHYFPDAIVIVKEEADARTVDSTPVLPRKTSLLPAYVICCFYCLLIVSTLAFQVSALLNPPIATVTIVPKSQTVTTTGTLQLGRVLRPLTISQSQTVATTGTGHQDAKAASGTVTFYNGQQTAQTVAQGTVFTDRAGVSIVTMQPATIPPGNPRTGYGSVTVTAQAVDAGSKGNIPAGEVNTPIALAVFVKNNQFAGGQDERDFQTVAKSDIDNTASPLQVTLDQSMQDTLTGQLKSGEALVSPKCTTTQTSDHQAGQEATQVKVTVSETCSGIAYSTQELTSKVMQLLTSQAAKTLGSGYSILENPQITITQATPAKRVLLSFTSISTWIYALSTQEQHSLKKLIAGKTKAQAIELLTRLPGIERVSLQSSGFGDDTRIPKKLSTIHLTIMYGI